MIIEEVTYGVGFTIEHKTKVLDNAMRQLIILLLTIFALGCADSTGTPEQGAPQDAVAETGTPEQEAPQDAVAETGTPEQKTPRDEMALTRDEKRTATDRTILVALSTGDWQTILQLDPNNADALAMKKIAEIKIALDNGDYQTALSLDPNHFGALALKIIAEGKVALVGEFQLSKIVDGENRSQLFRLRRMKENSVEIVEIIEFVRSLDGDLIKVKMTDGTSTYLPMQKFDKDILIQILYELGKRQEIDSARIRDLNELVSVLSTNPEGIIREKQATPQDAEVEDETSEQETDQLSKIVNSENRSQPLRLRRTKENSVDVFEIIEFVRSLNGDMIKVKMPDGTSIYLSIQQFDNESLIKEIDKDSLINIFYELGKRQEPYSSRIRNLNELVSVLRTNSEGIPQDTVVVVEVETPTLDRIIDALEDAYMPNTTIAGIKYVKQLRTATQNRTRTEADSLVLLQKYIESHPREFPSNTSNTSNTSNADAGAPLKNLIPQVNFATVTTYLNNYRGKQVAIVGGKFGGINSNAEFYVSPQKLGRYICCWCWDKNNGVSYAVVFDKTRFGPKVVNLATYQKIDFTARVDLGFRVLPIGGEVPVIYWVTNLKVYPK